MAMSRKQLREWPWNNRPSARHVFAHKHSASGGVAVCQRCGTRYVYAGGGSAAVYCVPTPEWLHANPGDDGKHG